MDGADGSENVGISSTKAGENPAHRKPKVSWATKIDPGLGDPKPRLKSVGDGQAVNIRLLRRDFDGVTLFQTSSAFWLYAFLFLAGFSGKSGKQYSGK